MKTLALVVVAVLVGAAGSEAHADDAMQGCVEQVRAQLAKTPAVIVDNAAGNLLLVTRAGALFHCRELWGMPEPVVAARQVKGRWRVEPVATFSCPSFKASGLVVTVNHADVCPRAWYHPNTCEHYTSQISLSNARPPAVKRTATRRKPICDVCPDSNADCLKRARRVARKHFEKGDLASAARLMRDALAHAESEVMNAESPDVDPWAINDALLYNAGSKACLGLAETWKRFASSTARSRRAFEYNRRQCARRKRDG